MNIYFNHGKESGPWGTKIGALAAIARQKGFSIESPDYSGQPDPDARVEQLLNLRLPASNRTVLVGSSMGGYVATVASQIINPVGLFLMAPAFYLPGYKEQSPAPHARKTVIIHGLKDEVVPVENSIRFAGEHGTELHLIDGDHGLNAQLPKIEMLFDLFLDDVLELSDLPKTVTWKKITQKFEPEYYWVQTEWRQVISNGYANYRNESERRAVVLLFIALTEFCYDFMSEFSGYNCREKEPHDIANLLDLPKQELDHLLADYVARHGNESSEAPTIQMALEEFSFPLLLKCYGDIDGITESIYNYSSDPVCFDDDINEYLMDPDNPEEDADDNKMDSNDSDAEALVKTKACKWISAWLKLKLEGSNSIV